MMRQLLKLSGFVVIVTVVNLVTILAVIGPRTSTALPPGGASENGDTNGDGGRNIADVVYMLEWLFNDGPPPVAIALDPTLDDFLNHLSVEFLDDGIVRFISTLSY